MSSKSRLRSLSSLAGCRRFPAREAPMSLTAEQRRALAVLTGAGPNGTSQALLMSYGFSVSMIAGLISRGLATLRRDKVQAADRSVEVAQVRITAVGTEALAAEERFTFILRLYSRIRATTVRCSVTLERIPCREGSKARNSRSGQRDALG
jgi:hypothetical protein